MGRGGLTATEPLYLDNHLLVLDKPWGLLTQPSGSGGDSLETQGKAFLKARFAKPGAVFLEAVHRIDRVVGGAVLFARTSKALARLNAAQREGAIAKTYRALVGAVPPAPEGVLEDWLVHDEEGHCAHVARPGANGARACRLHWRLLETRPDGRALLEIGLDTGRYHQIRAQLAHAGWPIVGDRKYGAPDDAGSPNGGIALVSWSIAFPHPVTHGRLTATTRLTL